MKKFNPLVKAQVQELSVRAALRVAELERDERQVPLLSGTSGRRLTLARKLTEARDERDAWEAVVRIVNGMDTPAPRPAKEA